MALETTKTTYLNGSSKDGGRVLANFSSSLSESGTMTINETISDNANLDTLDTVEADFKEFRELAKNELKKLNTQDTEANVPSDKSGDKAATPTSNNEVVKDNKPADAVAKVDDKPEAGTPDEAKVSGVKDSEVKQPVVSNEVKQPVLNEESKEPAASEEAKQPVQNEETKEPASTASTASTEETNQPAASNETKQPVLNSEAEEPVSSDEVKVSDVKDGENVDESN